MRYVECEASGPLRPFVRCFWQLTGDVGRRGVLVRGLPEGGVDFMYDLGDPQLAARNGGAAGSAGGQMFGAIRRAQLARFAARVELFGVSFRPGAGRAFFGLPLFELCDDGCDLGAHKATRRFAIGERLAEAKGFAARCRLMGRELLAAARAQPRPDPVVGRAVDLIDAQRGRVRLGELCAATGLGERTLQRRFRAEVGLTVQELAGIRRFAFAKQALLDDPRAARVELALRAGYADQAHFNHEFKRIAGVNPTEYLRERVGIRQSSAEAAR